MSSFKKFFMVAGVVGLSLTGQAFGDDDIKTIEPAAVATSASILEMPSETNLEPQSEATSEVASVTPSGDSELPSQTLESTPDISGEASFDNVDELLSHLEGLVEPVHQKVVTCNEELLEAQAKVDAVESQLTSVSGQRNKALQSLKVLKAALEQPGCSICLGQAKFSRETVGAAIEVKLAAHKTFSAKIKSLTGDLVAAQQALATTQIKVANWIAKEKELLSQIDKVEGEQASQVEELSKILEAGEQLATSIVQMLKPVAKPVAKQTVVEAEKSPILVEVEEVIGSK